MAIDHEDTWRMWDPHKLDFLCRMESSSCHFESIRIQMVLGWVGSSIYLAWINLGRIGVEDLGFGIRGTINDAWTLEWHKYLIKDINK